MENVMNIPAIRAHAQAIIDLADGDATVTQLALGILQHTDPPRDFGPDVRLIEYGPYATMYEHIPSKRVLSKWEVPGFLASYKPVTPDPGWQQVHQGLAERGAALDTPPPGEEPL